MARYQIKLHNRDNNCNCIFKTLYCRSIISFIYLAFIILLLIFAPKSHAGGGAHTIDDASVETPGVCHIEYWMTNYNQHQQLFNLSPACTTYAWPRLEIGGTIRHVHNNVNSTVVAPGLKLNLLTTDNGFGMAILGNADWNLHNRHIETASLIVPITIPLNDQVWINLNYGWTYTRSSTSQYTTFYGIQIERDIGKHTSLMLEIFRPTANTTGVQSGLRWNPYHGNVDIDFLLGRRIDGTTAHTITLGLTLRH